MISMSEGAQTMRYYNGCAVSQSSAQLKESGNRPMDVLEEEEIPGDTDEYLDQQGLMGEFRRICPINGLCTPPHSPQACMSTVEALCAYHFPFNPVPAQQLSLHCRYRPR